ncbi:MAG: site-specific integrase [Candidatus Cloacimonetes bacterium]|nr:site-specific integrase [Candidatus Cloacimonadota bacterium]MCF7815058.1 site-specific integrase [Candidatus Cloacimonadota bacterium]MCF7868549.1 site-specific integrase [Candidatus Cloacimonadota bacterium]MCF7884261.1 site-specific integrase [Candidatus Cloacimonadota bacterium]
MQIELKECSIKDEKRIALIFKYDREVIDLIKQIEGRKWSVNDKFWHIPYQEEVIQKLNKQFKDKLEFVEYSEVPAEYIDALVREDYNESTIKTYSQNFRKFLKHYPNTKPADITPDQIRKYIVYLVEEKKCSPSYQNNAITAIRFYYTKVLDRELDDYYAPRPHRPKSTPKVLNEHEVATILKYVTNLRDKCMIFLVYSAGLSPSEIIYLKPEHIDSKAMKIFISSAKGDKDRYVVLAEKLLVFLQKYFKQYKPKMWLFESNPGKQYSKRKLQKAFQTAVKRSGIKKTATLTILKNSFAVHLIEKGVDIRYIQKMLGHKQTKTTMKYLKASKKDIKAITSPLDNLEI